MKSGARILVVDDDEDICYIVTRSLEKKEYEVLGVGSGLDAIGAVTSQRFHLALVDIKMPDMTGQKAIVQMRRYEPQIPIIIITGSPDWAGREFGVTVQGCLRKPFRLEQLRRLVERVLGEGSQEEA